MEVEFVEVVEPEEVSLAVAFQPAVITADFDGLKKRLEELLEPYGGATREGLEKLTAKELRPFRADLNKMSKALNEKRLEIKRQYTAPLNDFEAKVKELDALIQEPCKLIDEVIKDKEQTERDERQRYLEERYAEFCEANGVERFAECVPFERILERGWLNKSTQLGKACNELAEKMTHILSEYQAVRSSVYYDPKGAELTFFETLSMAEVVKRDIAKRDAEAKAEALRAEIEANRKNRAASMEKRPENGSEPPEKRDYSFTIRCTEQQRDELVAWFKANGINGSFKEVRHAVQGVA